MKCKKHKKTEAIGVCISCSSGLCEECRISVSGISYCKPCLEEGKIHPGTSPDPRAPSPARPPRRVSTYRPVRIPQSTRRPIRPLFFLGAIGMIILMVSMCLYVGLHYLVYLEGAFQSPLITASFVVLVSSVIAGIGFFGYWWNYGLRNSLGAFICTLIFSWWLMLGEILLGIHVNLLHLVIRDIGIAAFGVMLEIWASAIGEVSLFDVNEWLTRITKILLSIAALMFFFSSVLGLGSDFLLGPGPIVIAELFRGYMIIFLGVGTLFLVISCIIIIIILVTTKFGLERVQQETSTTTST